VQRFREEFSREAAEEELGGVIFNMVVREGVTGSQNLRKYLKEGRRKLCGY
jgi:hypothetical protein